MTTHLPFGEDNAARDDLVFACPVRLQTVKAHDQVLTGPWGTGKTAVLFIENRELHEALAKWAPEFEQPPWYIDEETLKSETVAIYAKLEGKHLERLAALEALWRSEIYRRAAIQLALLRKHRYVDVRGAHWDDIAKNYETPEQAGTSLAKLMKVLSTWKTVNGDRMDELHQAILDRRGTQTEKSVKRCLEDISDLDEYPLQPVVAIEPLDQPTRRDNMLASDVVSSLLNVFIADFLPEPGSPVLRVMVAVPWARQQSKAIQYPHRLLSVTRHLSWTPAELREFINARINWEFERVGRTRVAPRIVPTGFTGEYDLRNGGPASTDPWTALFGPTITNDHYRPEIHEDTFAYVLRHTQYRPRQLQLIARRAVEACAARLRLPSTDDVLRTQRVSEEDLRRGVSDALHGTGNQDGATDFLLMEAERRYPGITANAEHLQGVPTHFSEEQLRKRLGKSTEAFLDQGYDIGLLGLEILIPESRPNERNPFGHLIDREMYSRRAMTLEGKTQRFHCWHVFQHTAARHHRPAAWRSRIASIENASIRYVLHPSTYEYFVPARRGSDRPIGGQHYSDERAADEAEGESAM